MQQCSFESQIHESGEDCNVQTILAITLLLTLLIDQTFFSVFTCYHFSKRRYNSLKTRGPRVNINNLVRHEIKHFWLQFHLQFYLIMIIIFSLTQVFVHCDMRICDMLDPNSRCTHTCVPLGRLNKRDVTTPNGGNSSRAYQETDGPIRLVQRYGKNTFWTRFFRQMLFS